jgi:hypothetical protein
MPVGIDFNMGYYHIESTPENLETGEKRIKVCYIGAHNTLLFCISWLAQGNHAFKFRGRTILEAGSRE